MGCRLTDAPLCRRASSGDTRRRTSRTARTPRGSPVPLPYPEAAPASGSAVPLSSLSQPTVPAPRTPRRQSCSYPPFVCESVSRVAARATGARAVGRVAKITAMRRRDYPQGAVDAHLPVPQSIHTNEVPPNPIKKIRPRDSTRHRPPNSHPSTYP